MDNYVNITLDITPIAKKQLDLRIPRSMTLKEMLQTVLESYQLDVTIHNPIVRIVQTGEVFVATSKLEGLKNGLLLKLEMI